MRFRRNDGTVEILYKFILEPTPFQHLDINEYNFVSPFTHDINGLAIVGILYSFDKFARL
jgi:hypothetical protein